MSRKMEPTRVNIHEAKSTLSRLIAQVEDSGSEFALCRAGKPVARLSPMAKTTPPPPTPPTGGRLQGQIWLADDFDAFLPAEAAIFGLGGAK